VVELAGEAVVVLLEELQEEPEEMELYQAAVAVAAVVVYQPKHLPVPVVREQLDVLLLSNIFRNNHRIYLMIHFIDI
jgi:hypothetical protein